MTQRHAATCDIAYDDGDSEAHVPFEFIRAPPKPAPRQAQAKQVHGQAKQLHGQAKQVQSQARQVALEPLPELPAKRRRSGR